MQTDAEQDALLDAVTDLRQTLARVRLPLEVEGAADARATLLSVLEQLDDHVLPRLRELDAPLLAVVGGSTGAGKSTLVNSLVRRAVSVTGVLRPTTRSPVLVHHPSDAHWFETDRVLPTLLRTSGSGDQIGGLHLVASEVMPAGLALLDAPDLDSVVVSNRELARQLLAAADLWLFVTSAARYSDAVPWESLRLAGERGTAIGVVLDRAPAAGADEVIRHFAQTLAAQELGAAPLFVVPESPLTADGMLDEQVVEPIRGWIADLAGDAAARDEIARQTVAGTVTSLSRRVAVVAMQADQQSEVAASLNEDVDHAYRAAHDAVADVCRSGSVLRGEVLARWQELVGTGDLLRSTQQADGAELYEAVHVALVALVVENADAAADLVWASWRARADGTQVVSGVTAALSRSSVELRTRTSEAVRAWQRGVRHAAREDGDNKRGAAANDPLRTPGAGAIRLVAVFGGTRGAQDQPGVLEGSDAVPRDMLASVFADPAVRELASTQMTDLLGRVDSELDGDASRFRLLLDGEALDPAVGPDLRTALRRIEGVG